MRLGCAISQCSHNLNIHLETALLTLMSGQMCGVASARYSSCSISSVERRQPGNMVLMAGGSDGMPAVRLFTLGSLQMLYILLSFVQLYLIYFYSY